MKLLGNRAGKAPANGRTSAGTVPQPFNELAVRWTKELARTVNLAVMLAKSRALRSISAADFLAAMYLNHWDGLANYWEDSGEIEKYLETLCRVSPQRWHKWLLEYEASRKEQEKELKGRIELGRKKSERRTAGDGLLLSRELESVLRRAGRISPGRERQEGRTIPILTSESVLLAMAREWESQVGRRLEATGLDVERLERAAKDPKRAPIH
jgi:hypothetical protein